ncbi:sugar isomerase domain-containing protein [Treponema parvum]|uniref:sugar isomerase domain-containing protein n=1 Tax=Treponema parvum TaxID=138851 RepID=UPI001AEBDC2D|nr:SIS domain-containing protein [Treponema parvum]QTQ16408.1 SIS domain-containing protein [Treponema parvum]
MKEGDVLKLYRKEVFDIIDEIYGTEEKNILKAARMVADHVKKDKIVYVFGPGGHSNLAAMEVFFRAGGLMHVSAILNQETMLSNGALKSMAAERLPGYGKIVIEDYGIGEGDLLIIVNAYGINSATIDACLTAQSHGAKVIGVSSHAHANTCPKDHPARHPSKKNLHEIADCSVDCKIKLGDATIEIPGFEQKIGALSTYANAFVMNGIITEAINMLVNEGINPPVWRSGNCPGGDEWNNRFIDKFRKSIRSL